MPNPLQNCVDCDKLTVVHSDSKRCNECHWKLVQKGHYMIRIK